jgi:hypothetical protein
MPSATEETAESDGRRICHTCDHQRFRWNGLEPCTCAITSRATLADTGLCCAQKPAISAFVHRTFKVPGTPWAALIMRVIALEVKTVSALGGGLRQAVVNVCSTLLWRERRESITYYGSRRKVVQSQCV